MLLCACLLLSCGGRSLVYKPDIVQGNILDEDEVARLEAGMNREEVRAIVGTPLADNVFREDDWHYLHSVHPGDGTRSSRIIVLHFRKDVLTHISGKVVAGRSEPDAAENQQRVIRVPDAPKPGIFGGLFDGKDRGKDALSTETPKRPDAVEATDSPVDSSN